ncbi:hypothetical protein B0T21DRAFT_293280 [Apiosordaria backusii]|uniref:PLD phosphodiesterase domain-containing protein n=1 Tax=Apiosordaria backusii TaxID=314023 RepID=A0AA40B2D7_9PEZI|nr:hypothetical protein B0T21DRAFT_293280 [Apiosordaria backusii]
MKKHQIDLENNHISDRLLNFCNSPRSVSSLISEDPTLSPEDAWEKLYGKNALKDVENGAVQATGCANGAIDAEQADLEKAAKCGKWGDTKPSELFLKIYHDALCTLDEDPSRGMVSPSLMGTCGIIPLSIISTIPDIARHIANVIVRAQTEVFVATNYWQNGAASSYIAEAIRELDRRVAARGGPKVKVKILYDRGSPKQVFQPRYFVSEKDFTGPNVNLPPRAEIPNIEMNVVNYHQPVMGTFHAKYVIVDRKIALLQSNNVQDNDNLEMMIHLEGPVVDSFVDVALLSWGKPWDGFTEVQNDIEEANGNIATVANGYASQPNPNNLHLDDNLHAPSNPHYDPDIASEISRFNTFLAPTENKTHLDAVNTLLNHTTNPSFPPNPTLTPNPPPTDRFTPYIPHSTSPSSPIALVTRSPYGPPTHRSLSNPQNASWLSALKNAKKSVFIQSPTLNAEPLLPAIIEACERGIDVTCWICLGYNDAGELLPHQNGHNEKIASDLYRALSPAGRERLHYYWYVAKDQTVPLVQSKRKRSCHIKIMIIDDEVGIMGNGNQDTQSWFHSCEINVMVDSREVCEGWMEGLRRNQNTGLYGALDRQEGVWRDGEGKEAAGAIGPGAGGGGMGWVKGFVGAVKRVKGTGGF